MVFQKELQEKGKEIKQKAKKDRAILDKIKKDKENANLLTELNHLKEDMNTIVHQHDHHDKDPKNNVKKKKKKKKAYVVDAEIGKLQDQINNFDLLADDEELEEGDGHKHHHHHHHKSSKDGKHHHIIITIITIITIIIVNIRIKTEKRRNLALTKIKYRDVLTTYLHAICLHKNLYIILSIYKNFQKINFSLFRFLCVISI